MKMTVGDFFPDPDNDDLEYALYEGGADVRTDSPIRTVILRACDYPEINWNCPSDLDWERLDRDAAEALETDYDSLSEIIV